MLDSDDMWIRFWHLRGYRVFFEVLATNSPISRDQWFPSSERHYVKLGARS